MFKILLGIANAKFQTKLKSSEPECCSFSPQTSLTKGKYLK